MPLTHHPALMFAGLGLVLPLDPPGTRTEILWLRESNLLGRAFFIMPPSEYTDRVDLATAWNRAISEYVEQGLRLPQYRHSGMIFRVSENGLPVDSCPLHLGVEDMKGLIDRLLAKPPGRASLHAPEIQQTAGIPVDPPQEDWAVYGTFESAMGAEVCCTRLVARGFRAVVKYPPPELMASFSGIPFLVLLHPWDAETGGNSTAAPRGERWRGATGIRFRCLPVGDGKANGHR